MITKIRKELFFNDFRKIKKWKQFNWRFFINLKLSQFGKGLKYILAAWNKNKQNPTLSEIFDIQELNAQISNKYGKEIDPLDTEIYDVIQLIDEWGI